MVMPGSNERALEAHRNRLAGLDHRVVAELDHRPMAAQRGCRSTAALLRSVLRVAPGTAAARVRAAHDLAERESESVGVLPPRFELVAAGQEAGALSAEQAQVIVRAVDALPATVRAEHGAAVERELVGHARQFDPSTLARLAQHLHAVLDPDGHLTTDADHQVARSATLTTGRDGSGELRARLTPSALAQWQAVLSSLAAPRPAADGTPDPRRADQRRHDALADAAERLLRSGELPECGGTPTTVLLTLSLDQLEARTGMVTTGHGGTLSVAAALQLAGEAEVIPVVLDRGGGVLAYGRSRRTATVGQRRAMAARDGGCLFPGCDAPPQWCQAHHVVAWQDGGRTDLANLGPLCGYHHREHERLGWTFRSISGVPWAIPPPWIDPEQRPMRNPLHHPEQLLESLALT